MTQRDYLVLIVFLFSLYTKINLAVEVEEQLIESENQMLQTEIDQDKISLDEIINRYKNKISDQEKKAISEKGKLFIKLLNIISDIFKQKKITFKQKNNLQNIIAQIKALNQRNNKSVDKEQIQIEQALIQGFFKLLQEKAEVDILKVLIDLATVKQDQLELSFTPKKLTNLITLLLELIVPLIDINPIIEKAISITQEINSKFDTTSADVTTAN